MNELISVLEQGQQLYIQHAPTAVLTKAVPAGIAFLVAGIAISVLGAKLARFGLTAVAVVLGGMAGHWFARANDLHPLLCILCGAFLVGIIGFQTFRLWVGLGTALMVTALAVGVFSNKEIRPAIQEFESQPAVAETTVASTTFTLPSAQTQEETLHRKPSQWFAELWGYLEQSRPVTARNARAITVVALLMGLSVGLMVTRWALIVTTSLIGTLLVALGAAALLRPSVPDSVAALQNNPGLALAGLAGFLVTSLILQALLSRKAESEPE